MSAMRFKTHVIGLVIAALFQTAVLGAMIHRHHIELTTGEEVVLQSLMRDPRDFFRGHYTRLQLAVDRLDGKDTVIDPNLGHGTAYLILDQAEPFWTPKSLTNEKPGNGVFLRVQVLSFAKRNQTTGDDSSVPSSNTVRVSTGFERYYAPKTRAQFLEKVNQDSKLGIILSVQPNGTAKIKGVSVDGELSYDETIF